MSGKNSKIAKHFSPPEYKYTVCYNNHEEGIEGFPQLEFKVITATSVEDAITVMESIGVPEHDIQSIDQHM